MNINTSQFKIMASQLTSWKRSHLMFSMPHLTNRHEMIQTQLTKLSNYLTSSARAYEENEQRISQLFQVRDGMLRTSSVNHVDFISMALKRDDHSYLSKEYEYALKEIHGSYSNRFISASANMDVGEFRAKGECEFQIWKDKKFDPNLEINTELEASVLAGTIATGIGTKNIRLNAQAHGSVGTVYANAHAVLNQNEQTLEAGIGAAAMRGEVKVSFKVFGASVTLEGSGSIGSAEANFSYHHKNREWEIGSKLGFIAGLGFKIRVNY